MLNKKVKSDISKYLKIGFSPPMIKKLLNLSEAEVFIVFGKDTRFGNVMRSRKRSYVKKNAY